MGTEPVDQIKVPCKCGATLKAPASAVGQKARCPRCGELLLVAAPAQQDDSDAPMYDPQSDEQTDSQTHADAAAQASVPPLPSPPQTFPPTTAKVPAPIQKQSGSMIKGVILSAVGAFVGALVWFGIAKATDYEIGWIAWGVGLAAGFGMMIGYKGHGVAAGMVASAMAIGGIILGKYLVFSMVVVPLIEEEFSLMGESRTRLFFSTMFNPIDILFIVIAVASAFKMASAGGEAATA